MKSFKQANAESIRRVLKLLTMSAMSREEKTLWLKLIPELGANELDRLVNLLSKEVESMTSIWLDILQKRA